MPGLIDCHIHISEFNALTFDNFRVARFEISPQLQMLYAVFHAQICLEMGFTTLRDMGGVTYAGLNVAELVAIRDAIDAGIIVGPRLRVGGWTTITGSHLDLVLPRNAIRQAGVTADGPWELRKLARTNLRIGCDFLKTCLSGGAGTGEEPTVRNMTQEELEAVVDEAHAFGKPCASHCFTPESQRMAVRAGVDTIEHCVWTDDDALAMMKAEGKVVVPTLTHRTDRAIEVRRRAGASEATVQRMKRIQPDTKKTFQRLHQAGIKIAMGTDVQIDPEMGASALELDIYVAHGMTPMEAILTATKNAAEALRMDRDVGTLEPKKFADIIAVEGDPLEDIRILQERKRIKLVMKGGQVYVDRREGQDKRVILDAVWSKKLVDLFVK